MIDIVVLAAGPNDEFIQSGYRFPKNLIEVGGIPLIARVLSSRDSIDRESQSIVCIDQKEDSEFHTSSTIKLVAPNSRIVHVKKPTRGALCTSLLAVDLLADDNELLILNGDSLILRDLAEFIDYFRSNHLDAGTVCFKSIHPRFSFVKLGPNFMVTEVAEKRPISHFATAGIYWFKSSHSFKQAAFSSIRRRQDVDGKFYVAPVLNEFILKRQLVGAKEIKHTEYANLQSPKLIDDFRKKINQPEWGEYGSNANI